MITLTKKQIDFAIPHIGKNLDKYLWLQENLHKCNISTSREYQKNFNGYYRVRRNKHWQKLFYDLFQLKKRFTPKFSLLLFIIFTHTKKRIEASFVSKMVATINSNSPIIDSIVLKNLGLKLPGTYKFDRFKKTVDIYNKLVKFYKNFLATELGKYLITEFKKQYPDKKISRVKMLDFVLWQTRD